MKRSEKQGRKGKVHTIKHRVSKIAGRDKKPFFNEQCLIIEENNKRGKTLDISSEKLQISREHSAQR